MSSPSDRMLKLMAYADGELEGAELEEVEGWIANDGESVRFANELANLGDLVKIGHAASADGKAVLSFDIADAVMAKAKAIEADAPSASKPDVSAPVISLAAAREHRQKNPGRNLKVVAGTVCAALALAASVFVMTRPREETPMARAPVAPQQASPSPSPLPNGSNGNSGVEVDVAETPGHSVSVFYLPSESTLTTSVVVWVDETGAKK